MPEYDRVWDRRLAAHLYRRAGYAANTAELQQATTASPADVVRGLLERRESPSFTDQMNQLARAVINAGNASGLSSVWLYRMTNSPDQLLAKTTLFWHGHFATSAEKVEDAQMIWQQYQLLRQYALGDFQQLVQAISRDPAMLVYLDSATNRKSHPNENYARELMELFCLGEGNYSERDIREMARCFTGWEVRRDTFRFNRYQHDSGSKSFLGKTGRMGGEDAVRVVLEQPAAPRFIANKLFRYFVCSEPAPSDALLEPLARQLRENGFQIGPVIGRILSSQIFYSSHSLARQVRSPVELAVGLLRAFEATTDFYQLAERLATIGQALFYPPSVKGWDGGRTWINSSTLLGRANLVRDILQSDKTKFSHGSLEELADAYNLRTAEQKIDWLVDLLLAVPPPAAARETLVAAARQGGSGLADIVHLMSTLPEFQLN